METNVNVIELAQKSATVAAEHDAHLAAIAAETQARADLLSAVIEKVRPALRAVSSRIKIENQYSSGRDGLHPWSDAKYFDARGLYLGDESVGPAQGHRGDDTNGTYVGTDYFLLIDGSLAEVVYEGQWSRWQGAVNEWVGRTKPISVADFAKSEERVNAAIAAISGALDKQAAGAKATRTKAALERAEKLRALVALTK